ncbi:hypothetical protein C4H03_RS23210 [Vibrio parahaemolyticus]|nr:hypothetical protein [Vibrio parahaemolyticus]EJB0387253.1 hypothetical protein [Vibrio parahaemolyticus]EJG1105979.1 hypothetical protein [Vibrio parahaemolyticus]EJG1628286.1 hypothetical protein [Vibrio parahaemolyticus]ELA6668423.1 hypothetical protein [Vibrio parahaemolyticus]
MEECNTWECVNSFSYWLSAIGTLLVSGIALWLSVRDRFIRMSNRFSIGALLNGAGLDMNVYVLEFTNIGVRPVTVTNYKWRIPFNGSRKSSLITFPQLDDRVAPYCSKLPIELTDGKSGNIFHTEDFFTNRDDPKAFLYPENKLIAFLRIHLFRVYICTSVGDDISVKIDRSLRRKLWKEYLKTYA